MNCILVLVRTVLAASTCNNVSKHKISRRIYTYVYVCIDVCKLFVSSTIIMLAQELLSLSIPANEA